jgi:hypothetical protein
MVNRAALFQAIEPLIEPTPSQREAIRKSLDKVLLESVQTLPLNAANSLPSPARHELSTVIRDLCSAKELAKIANRWEPQRKLDSDLKQTLRADLIDLLMEKRSCYRGLPSMPLNEARKQCEDYRGLFQNAVPTKDAVRLLKIWDKHLQPVPSTRDEVVQRLLALLSGTSPAEKKQRSSKKKTA